MCAYLQRLGMATHRRERRDFLMLLQVWQFLAHISARVTDDLPLALRAILARDTKCPVRPIQRDLSFPTRNCSSLKS